MHKGKGASRSTWLTPQWVLDIVRATLDGPIGLDPATTADNPTGAVQFYTPEQDGLAMPWSASSIFLNPPWSRKESMDLRPWLARAMAVRDNSIVRGQPEMFILLSAAMNANWFHDYLAGGDAYFFPRGRIAYDSPSAEIHADAPGFDSVLCYWGDRKTQFKAQCHGRGLVLGL